MGVTSSVSVTIPASPATRLAAARTAKRRLRVYNSGGQILYLGGSDLTTGNGTAVPAGGVIDFDSVDPYDLYGLSASGSLDVRILSVLP